MKKGMVNVLSTILGATVGAVVAKKIAGKKVEEKMGKIDKFKRYYNMLNQWLILKQEGQSLEKYFTDNGYKTLAIYGMGEMGNRLYEELKNTSIEIKYAIDKNASGKYADIDVKDLEDELEVVDVVVVSAIFVYGEIVEELGSVIDFPIISLEDVVYEC